MITQDGDVARGLKIDKSQPNIARVYDYLLGGKDNFQADRDEAERLRQLQPHVSRLTQENRLFLRRAVHWLAAERGIRQFLDVGSGLPTASNTHEVAQFAAPDAVVAYVDRDPVVVSHADALLADGHGVVAVPGDVTDPAAILADPRVNALLSADEPCAVVIAAVIHFLSPDDARRVLTEFARLTPPGSYLAVSVGVSRPALAREYKAAAVHGYGPDDVGELLSGLTIIDPPGLVDARNWAPGIPASAPSPDDARILAAVALAS